MARFGCPQCKEQPSHSPQTLCRLGLARQDLVCKSKEWQLTEHYRPRAMVGVEERDLDVVSRLEF